MKWINDTPTKVNGKKLPWSEAWYSMRTRCTSQTFQARCPTYRGCRVCKSWHTASNFKAWYDEHYVEGYHLDKDFLGDGKFYSPETCCYVPPWLNSMLGDCSKARGHLPQGVSRHGDRYQAQLMINGKKTGLGLFPSVEGAFTEYVIAKREYVLTKKPLVLELPRGDEIWEGVLRILADQIAEGFEMVDPKRVRCSERL